MKENNIKNYYGIILSGALLLFSIIIFFTLRGPNLNIWILIWSYFLIDIGFIVSLILGIKSKIKSVKIFSILTSSVFIILMTACIYLLLLANGISES